MPSDDGLALQHKALRLNRVACGNSRRSKATAAGWGGRRRQRRREGSRRRQAAVAGAERWRAAGGGSGGGAAGGPWRCLGCSCPLLRALLKPVFKTMFALDSSIASHGPAAAKQTLGSPQAHALRLLQRTCQRCRPFLPLQLAADGAPSAPDAFTPAIDLFFFSHKETSPRLNWVLYRGR